MTTKFTRIVWLMPLLLFLPGQMYAAGTSSAPFAQNAFNPDLSAIVDFAYANENWANDKAEKFSVPGFADSANREGKSRGFNFNYLELSLQADVDPYFDLFAVVTATTDGVEVEEAYVNAHRLPYGFGLRAGMFLSAFGRFNGMHTHFWDFYDAPLVYEMFTGGEGFNNPGVRLSWTAPLNFLLQVNAEAYQGVWESGPTFDAQGLQFQLENGSEYVTRDSRMPGVYTGSVKASFDKGKNVVLLGVSGMVGASNRTSSNDALGDYAFHADQTVLVDGEVTYKYLLSSYRSIVVQSEFLLRHSPGEVITASGDAPRSFVTTQSGFYSQVTWRFDNAGRWRIGGRYDLLATNRNTLDGVEQRLPEWLPRYTAMAEFSTTEFARIRLQYDYDRSRFLGGVRKTVQEVFLQATFSIGPHGAHSF